LDESSSLLAIGSRRQGANKTSEVVKAIFYGLQVFYSFFIMLIFMTYNGWVMVAVAVGASIGHYAFGIHTGSAKRSRVTEGVRRIFGIFGDLYHAGLHVSGDGSCIYH